MDYTALIIDIEKSKNYDVPTRINIQEYMSAISDILNNMYYPFIARPMMFSGGDELQGLFFHPVYALLWFRMLEMVLYPVRLRAGIGVGEWNIKMENAYSTMQDGPAYHRARNAIVSVHNNPRRNIAMECDKQSVDLEMANFMINLSHQDKKALNTDYADIQMIIEIMSPLEKAKEMEPIMHMLSQKFGIKELPNEALDKDFQLEAYREIYNRRISFDEGNTEKQSTILKYDKVWKYMSHQMTGESYDNNEFHYILAAASDCTRQNIAKKISRGRLDQIREMDYMALKYLGEGKY